MRVTPCLSLTVTVGKHTLTHKNTLRLSTELCRISQPQGAEVVDIHSSHST